MWPWGDGIGQCIERSIDGRRTVVAGNVGQDGDENTGERGQNEPWRETSDILYVPTLSKKKKKTNITFIPWRTCVISSTHIRTHICFF